MGITAYFYKNDKRINSTKLPSLNVGDFAVDVELKDTTNLFTPVITLSSSMFTSGSTLKSPIKFNYCYLPEFERYYYVRNWVWVKGIWQCDLEVDVLASFKNDIGNSYAYILRSAQYCDPTLIDTKYTTKSETKCAYSNIPAMWKIEMDKFSVKDGFFVVGIVNDDENAVGATSYYAVSGEVMRYFVSQMYASPSWLNITDASISTDLQKMLINPIQYITSCQWMPYGLSDAAGSNLSQTNSIKVGWWYINLPSGYNFYRITGGYLVDKRYVDISIPIHPQSSDATKNLWLRNAPYSNYQLMFFPFGVFPLDAAKLIGYDTIRCNVANDLITGTSLLTITRKKNGEAWKEHDIIYSASAQIGIPVSIAQMSIDTSRISDMSTWALSAGLALASDTEATSDLVNSAKDFIDTAVPDLSSTYDKWAYNVGEWMGNGMNGSMPQFFDDSYKQEVKSSATSLLSSVGKVAVNIGNAVLASSGTCKTTGSTGALSQYTLPITLDLFYNEIVPMDVTHYGRPFAGYGTINTFSGFVQCANEGTLSTNATAVERQAIVAAMTAGFYYE